MGYLVVCDWMASYSDMLALLSADLLSILNVPDNSSALINLAVLFEPHLLDLSFVLPLTTAVLVFRTRWNGYQQIRNFGRAFSS